MQADGRDQRQTRSGGRVLWG